MLHRRIRTIPSAAKENRTHLPSWIEK